MTQPQSGVEPKRRYPLPLNDFRRVRRAILRRVRDSYTAQWGPRRAQVNRTLADTVKVLVGLGGFALGERVAFAQPDLAEALECSERTVRRVNGKLDELPGLIQVHYVEAGELSYDGEPARRQHIEYQLSPELRSFVAQMLGRNPNLAAIEVPSPDNLAPDNLSPDLVLSNDKELKSEPALGPSTDRLNFELEPSEPPSPFPPAADDPPPSTIPTETVAPEATSAQPLPLPPAPPRGRQLASTTPRHLLTAGSPVRVPTRELGGCPASPSNPSLRPLRPAAALRVPFAPHHRGLSPAPLPAPDTELVDAIIRQHRPIAEGKGPFIPIDASDRIHVISALQCLTGCSSDQEKLAVCKRVSELALRDAQHKGNRAANLRFTFGGRNDNPDHPHYFLERLARIREHDEQLAKEHHGARPPPLAGPDSDVAPRHRSQPQRRSIAPPHHPPATRPARATTLDEALERCDDPKLREIIRTNPAAYARAG